MTVGLRGLGADSAPPLATISPISTTGMRAGECDLGITRFCAWYQDQPYGKCECVFSPKVVAMQTLAFPGAVVLKGLQAIGVVKDVGLGSGVIAFGLGSAIWIFGLMYLFGGQKR